MHLAAGQCHSQVVRSLLDHVRSHSKGDPEHPPASSGGELTAYVNAQNVDGETAVHYAAKILKGQVHLPKEDSEVMKLLLDAGGDVNVLSKTVNSQLCL